MKKSFFLNKQMGKIKKNTIKNIGKSQFFEFLKNIKIIKSRRNLKIQKLIVFFEIYKKWIFIVFFDIVSKRKSLKSGKQNKISAIII